MKFNFEQDRPGLVRCNVQNECSEPRKQDVCLMKVRGLDRFVLEPKEFWLMTGVNSLGCAFTSLSSHLSLVASVFFCWFLLGSFLIILSPPPPYVVLINSSLPALSFAHLKQQLLRVSLRAVMSRLLCTCSHLKAQSPSNLAWLKLGPLSLFTDLLCFSFYFFHYFSTHLAN